MKIFVSAILAACCALAQQHRTFTMQLPPPAEGAGGNFMFMGNEHTFDYVAMEMGIGGRVVKGAPYSAEAVSESTQRLIDGNRIARKNTTTLYRDGEGRTRREDTLGAIGPWEAAGGPARSILISDPVAGTSFVLQPRERIARKLPDPGMTQKMIAVAKEKAETEAQRQLEMKKEKRSTAPAGEPTTIGVFKSKVKRNGEVVEENENVMVEAGAGAHMIRSEFHGEPPKTETLGKQMVEGVQAEGTRTTMTIPAGAIGNDLPVQIVSERWFSPELQAVVMSKRNDPRTGESLYRLTNIRRSEPPRSLFEVPSDYTVKEDKPLIRTRTRTQTSEN